MKQDYTLDELQTEMTALAQLFDSVTLADPRMGLLDPATLQPLNKVAAMPALDAAGRGLKIEKAADGLRSTLGTSAAGAAAPGVTASAPSAVFSAEVNTPSAASGTAAAKPVEEESSDTSYYDDLLAILNKRR